MKKLLAIVLTVMLLTASAACAETACVAAYYNANLAATSEGQNFSVDLSDLSIVAASGLLDDVPTIQLDVDGGEGTLLAGEIQFIGSALVLNVEGLSQPLAVDLSSAGVNLQETLAPFFADPASMRVKSLPLFTGITIPKLPLMSLAGMIGATPTTDANGNQVAEFSVPYEMIKQLLTLATQYKDTIAGIQGVGQYSEMIFGLIDQLLESDSGIALSGTIADDGTTASMVIDFLPVISGTTADAAVAGLELAFAENQVNIDVNIYQESAATSVAQIAITSVPDAAELNFGMNIMGMIALSFSLYPEDGTQVAALELTAQDVTVGLSVTYGPKDNGNFFDFAFSIPETEVEFYTDSFTEDEVTYNGGIELDVATGAHGSEMNLTLTCETESTIGEAELRGIANAADAIDVTSLTEEQQAQIAEELNTVLADLMAYLNSLEPEMAA